MILPPLPEALIVRRNAHGFTHSFTALQMDKYGRDCAEAARISSALICDGEKWVDSETTPITYIAAYNAGCEDCALKIRGTA